MIEKSVKEKIFELCREAHNQPDRVARIPVKIPDDYMKIAGIEADFLYSLFSQIEERASEDLNAIYLSEVVEKKNPDRKTAEIEEKLLDARYPEVTRAMLHSEEYEPIIWEAIRVLYL